MRTLLITTGLALTLATPIWAAGGGSAPATTPTSTSCKAGEIYDKDTKACVDARESKLDDATRMEAARELAYVGRYGEALDVLDTLADAGTSDALTLRGFATRKAGDFDGAMGYYQAALSLDPDNWLARSYMGQGYVEAGDSTLAREQLTLIRTTGGRGTWAEISLRQAIERGAGYSY